MNCIKEFFAQTFADLTTAELLDIRGLGDNPLTAGQLSGLYSIVNYRYENMLPTTTHTDKNFSELCKAIESPGHEVMAYAIVGRLWEMGVEHSKRVFSVTYEAQGFKSGLAVARGAL